MKPNPLAIFAHRGNLAGPKSVRENSFDAISDAVHSGFGVEIDLRRDRKGRFYLSHDPAEWTAENDFERFAALFRHFADRPVALNVKELGYERELLLRQLAGDFGDRSFLFDFELLEPATPGQSQTSVRALPEGGRAVLAARASDRGESIGQALALPVQVIWLDEFERHWATAQDVRQIRASGRKVVAVSPELHGRDCAARLRRWADFNSWGIDGICTDFALEAREFFSHLSAG